MKMNWEMIILTVLGAFGCCILPFIPISIDDFLHNNQIWDTNSYEVFSYMEQLTIYLFVTHNLYFAIDVVFFWNFDIGHLNIQHFIVYWIILFCDVIFIAWEPLYTLKSGAVLSSICHFQILLTLIESYWSLLSISCTRFSRAIINLSSYLTAAGIILFNYTHFVSKIDSKICFIIQILCIALLICSLSLTSYLIHQQLTEQPLLREPTLANFKKISVCQEIMRIRYNMITILFFSVGLLVSIIMSMLGTSLIYILQLFSSLIILTVFCKQFMDALCLRSRFVELQMELDAKRIFLRNTSHEIRTPINTIVLGLQLLEKELFELNIQHEGLLEIVKDISSASEVTLEMVNNLLTHDKIKDGKLKLDIAPIRIWGLIERSVKPFNTQAKHNGVNLIINDSEIAELPDCWIDGDANKLGQLVRNLISNALKFTPSGGSVTVTATNLTDYDSSKHISKGNNSRKIYSDYGTSSGVKKWLEIEFTDTGAGISESNQPKLFKEIIQFNPGKLQDGKGSGLGLYISKGIVDLHGGQLSVYSAGEGRGTTFTLQLPVHIHEAPKDNNSGSGISYISNSFLSFARNMSRFGSYNSLYNLALEHNNNVSISGGVTSPVVTGDIVVAALHGEEKSNSYPCSQHPPTIFVEVGNDSHSARSFPPQPKKKKNCISAIENSTRRSFSTSDVNYDENDSPRYDFRKEKNNPIIKTTMTITGMTADSCQPQPKYSQGGERGNTISINMSTNEKAISHCLMQDNIIEKKRSSSKILKMDSSELHCSISNMIDSYHNQNKVGCVPDLSPERSSPNSLDTTLMHSPIAATSRHRSNTLTTNNNNKNILHELKVLIVDDVMMNRKMLQRLIRGHYGETLLSDNGRDALNQIQTAASAGASQHPIDVVLMDRYMPEMDGLEATRELRRWGYEGLVIGVTGAGTETEIAEFMDSGADCVLTKPVNVDSLRDKILELLKNKNGGEKLGTV